MSQLAIRSRKRGFASFTAVALIGTTAIALTMYASITIRQAKRASTEAANAQLRQLLQASMAYTQQQTPQSLADATVEISLPTELIGPGTRLSLTPDSETVEPGLLVMVQATHQGRSAQQTLAYDPSSGAWQVLEVVMP